MSKREQLRLPQPEALDKRVIKAIDPRTKFEEVVPELHPSQIEDIQFLLYTTPPVTHVTWQGKQNPAANRAAMEEWVERADLIHEDLQFLLCLPHSKFWSQVIFDQSLHQCLDSYLRSAPRHFDSWNELLPEIRELQEGIHRCVFMTFLRMSTHKESSVDFITPDTYGEILYENYIFDIPKLMDICALFGGDDNNQNGALLSKMVQNIFSKQPKYHDDLDDTIPTVYESLENILTRCGLDKEKHKFPKQLSSEMKFTNLCISELSDIILYLFDTAHTLLSFLKSYPPACLAFHRQGFMPRVASFYETLVPYLDNVLSHAGANISLKQHWKCSKALMLKTCHVVLMSSCINHLMNNDGTVESETLQACVEDYLQVVTSLLSEKRFLSAYNTRFCIEQDLDIIQSSVVAVDEARVRYILSAVDSAVHTYPSSLEKKKERSQVAAFDRPEKRETHSQADLGVMVNGDLDGNILQGAGLPLKEVSDVELESMISHIKDLLPDLGEGFIVKCLEELAYDVEKVICFILEDNLPEHLKCLDRNLSKEKVRKPVENQETVLDQRHSVFDQDEFDVFSGKAVDTSRIHKGKKREKLSLQSLLTDKSYITSSVQTRFSHYDVFGGIDEYDDEYDDTYDSQNVGALDADSADELTARRPFTTPRVLGGPPQKTSDSEGSEDEGDNSVVANTNTKVAQSGHALVNNSQIRGKEGKQDELPNKESAKHWQATKKQTSSQQRSKSGQQGKRGGGKDDQRSRDNRGSKPRSSGPQGDKGGGKDDEKIQRGRAYKEKNKARKANHNRKTGADRKRRGGMGPLPPGM